MVARQPAPSWYEDAEIEDDEPTGDEILTVTAGAVWWSGPDRDRQRVAATARNYESDS